MSEPKGLINLIYRAPLDMTYQHQIDFTSPSEQLTYWGSKIKYRLGDYTYVRRERRSIKVNKSFDELEGINYLAYQAHSGNKTKWYYCFVTDRAYVNDETTTLYFEIDVFQTFMFDYTFKPTYISQAHVDRWDANHKPIYSRTEEGLNYGTEYVTEKAYRMKVDSEYKHGFYLVYMKDIPGNIRYTNIGDNPIPYDILVIPNLEGSDTGTVVGVADAMTNNMIVLSSLKEFQRYMASSDLGNSIQQICYVPYLPFNYKLRKANAGEVNQYGIDAVIQFSFATTVHQFTSETKTFNAIVLNNIGKSLIITEFATMDVFSGLENKIPSAEMWSALKSAPRTTERDRRYESKLLCFPYRYNVFTDWVSAPALIKNEYIVGDKITIKGSIGLNFNTPRRFWIDKYRKDPEGRECSINQLIPYEQSITTDAYYTYMLQNRNQISANLTNAKISAISNVAGATVNGAMGGATGGVWGAVGGAITGAVGSGISGALNIQGMIRSENAKQSDIKNMPDTISASNDCSLAIWDDNTYITLYRKAISCDYEEQLAQYWHMYGYKVNKLDTPNLRSRVRYNFIKTVGANIEGAIESTYLATLKAIFDNGVTIWHYSNTDFNPLDYTYENPEVNLL